MGKDKGWLGLCLGAGLVLALTATMLWVAAHVTFALPPVDGHPSRGTDVLGWRIAAALFDGLLVAVCVALAVIPRLRPSGRFRYAVPLAVLALGLVVAVVALTQPTPTY